MKKAHAYTLLGAIIVGALAFVVYSQVTGNYMPPEAEGEPEAVSYEGMEQAIDANNAFGFDLFRALGSEKGNAIFSPYSISSALGMVYEGARGETADEIRRVFHMAGGDTARRAAIAVFLNGLNEKNSLYKLEVANALWAQKGFDFSKDYVSTVQKFYAGTAENVDFRGNSEAARVEINSWVSDRTQGKIRDLFAKGVIDDATRLVLTNAVYFKGFWAKAFNKDLTFEDDFKAGDGKTVKARFMRPKDGEARFGYAEKDGVQALEMDYKGDELAMVVMLPRMDLSVFEKKLDLETFKAIRASLAQSSVDVYMPKFKLASKYALKETFSSMGMPRAFTSEADFSGMTNRKDLAIGDVIHQAYIEVDEEGTEAAAATGVTMRLTSAMPAAKPEFKADRPFIFAVIEKDSGNVIFLGRVSDPTK